MIDLWVWSGNYDYYLEAFVRDYKGIVYTLPMGNLTHVGWKNFRVKCTYQHPAIQEIPSQNRKSPTGQVQDLDQAYRSGRRPGQGRAPQHEKAIYFYFDQLKILTDTFEVLFDGDGLSDPKLIEELWGSNNSN
jgi:hypothetical protein